MDDFMKLRLLTEEKLQGIVLTSQQKQRLEEELSVVNKTNAAGVFLRFHDTMSALKPYGAVCNGIMHCSFLCYILGLTKVNPLDYKLPFERYYNIERKALPYFPLIVKEEDKEKVLSVLREYFDEEFLQSYAFSLDVAKIGEYRLFTEAEIYQKLCGILARTTLKTMRGILELRRRKIFLPKRTGNSCIKSSFIPFAIGCWA